MFPHLFRLFFSRILKEYVNPKLKLVIINLYTPYYEDDNEYVSNPLKTKVIDKCHKELQFIVVRIRILGYNFVMVE